MKFEVSVVTELEYIEPCRGRSNRATDNQLRCLVPEGRGREFHVLLLLVRSSNHAAHILRHPAGASLL